jgi:uncharacterized membrane protein YbhN (UPF0104 family)
LDGPSVLKVCTTSALAARNWGSRARHLIQDLFVALAVARTPKSALKLLMLSVIVWGFEGGVFAAAASSFHYKGLPLGPWLSLATGSLATLIPSSPGYVGTFDFFTAAGLSAYGATAAVATATALTVHAVLWFPLTAAGLTYLLVARLRGRQARIQATAHPTQDST